MNVEPPVIYGIRNCDTMRKAMAWLDARQVEYRFHDYRKQGLEAALLRRWCDRLGWETLVNRRGTTWRRLDPSVRDGLDADRAIELMLEQPAIIRRPVLAAGDRLLVGFDPRTYAESLG